MTPDRPGVATLHQDGQFRGKKERDLLTDKQLAVDCETREYSGKDCNQEGAGAKERREGISQVQQERKYFTFRFSFFYS